MIDKSLVAYNNNRPDGVMTIIIPDSFVYHSVILQSETLRELLPLNCDLILQKGDNFCQEIPANLITVLT